MIYLAAPFFNEPQLEAVRTAETLMTELAIPFFSPRQQHKEGVPVPIRSAAEARDIFDVNADKLEECEAVLAVLSYLLPENQELALCDSTRSGRLRVELPDTGTVWEMGYAAGAVKPVYGWIPGVAPRKVNLMLTQGCAGVVQGLDGLKHLLNCIKEHGCEVPPSLLPQWEGGHV